MRFWYRDWLTQNYISALFIPDLPLPYSASSKTHWLQIKMNSHTHTHTLSLSLFLSLSLSLSFCFGGPHWLPPWVGWPLEPAEPAIWVSGSWSSKRNSKQLKQNNEIQWILHLFYISLLYVHNRHDDFANTKTFFHHNLKNKNLE